MNSLLLAPSPKTLRPHQERAISLLRCSLGKGNRRVVIQGPTGFGKTLVAAKIFEGALDKGNRVLFTAPAISLIDQTVSAFENEGIQHIGVMQANHPRTDSSSPVQVASVQTLARREIPSSALVVVDECHIRSQVIDDLMDERPDLFMVGLSATPWARGMGLRWEDLVIPTTISELIEGGYLSRFTALGPDVPDLSGVKSIAGDYAEDALEEIMGEAKLVGSIVETWLEQGENRPTLCFCVNRAHAALVQQQFQRAGVAAAYVDAFTDRAEMSYIQQKFEAGEIKVVTSVRKLTTGIDWEVSCLIDGAPTRSEMLHVQKIGRGLRVNPGTEDCLILDHAGNSIRLGLVTDIHHGELDKTQKGERQQSRPKAEKLPTPCSKCNVLFSGLECPSCGHVRKRIADVETADGKLVRIDGSKPKPTHAEKQAFWSMALWVDENRGKGRKLALALFKQKFGVWPRGLADIPTAPDNVFINYEKSRRIAYAKRQQKQRVA